jgi:hypothetical protein
VRGATLADAVLPAAGIGAVGGLMVGVTGVGAGTVISTLLLSAFPTIPPRVIVGSATLQAVAMKLAGVLSRRQFHLGETGLGVAMAVGAAPLGIAGAVASHYVPAALLRAILAWVLIGVGVLLVAQAVRRRRGGVAGAHGEARGVSSAAAPPRDPALLRVGLSGSLVGFVAGLTSIGTGTLFVTTLAGPLRIGAHRAVAAALVAGLITLAVSGTTHAMLGHLEPNIVVGAVLGSVPGVVTGTWLSHKLHARVLRGVIGAGIVAAAVVTLTRLRG